MTWTAQGRAYRGGRSAQLARRHHSPEDRWHQQSISSRGRRQHRVRQPLGHVVAHRLPANLQDAKAASKDQEDLHQQQRSHRVHYYSAREWHADLSASMDSVVVISDGPSGSCRQSLTPRPAVRHLLSGVADRARGPISLRCRKAIEMSAETSKPTLKKLFDTPVITALLGTFLGGVIAFTSS